jgi:hypothetical protein
MTTFVSLSGLDLSFLADKPKRKPRRKPTKSATMRKSA